jgi:GTP-binding protein Era
MPRTGYITLLGLPNAGKSTLLNALVGEKLSIVTAKAQTTWTRVTGIATVDDVQMIFLDTPGLLEAKDLLQQSMLQQALDAVSEADVLLLVVDPQAPLERARVVDALSHSRAQRLVAINKIDVAPRAAIEEATRWAERDLGARTFPISALQGTGVEDLRAAIAAALPEAPFLYPADEIASEPVRFFVAELVRETVFERYRQEIPYSVFTRVEEYREDQEPLYVGVTIFVERESQKGILVGKAGAGIRELGRLSREKIEHFLGRNVYLELWVKTLPGWRRKRADLARLGFRVPDEPR